METIRREIETDDKVREKILPLVRQAVRLSSDAVKETHRGNYDAAWDLVRKAQQIVSDAEEQLAESAFLQRSRIVDVAYQELVEAANILSILKDGRYTRPDELGVPSRPYLTGLADTVGELRRAVLDSIRRGELDSAERLLQYMEEILDELNTFDFPSALVPDLRRKCDVARSLVERSRGELTLALYQDRLINELRLFEKRIEEMKQ